MNTILTLAVIYAAAFLVCWLCYVVVMKLRDRHEGTSCRPCKRGIILVALPFLVVGWTLDVALNWTLFQILGPARTTTISGRLKDMRRDPLVTGWRRFVADFICVRMLNPWDKNGHC